MADRIAQRVTPTIERRSPVSSTVQRRAATTAPSAARALHERLGNQATHALVTRVLPAVQAGRSPVQPQLPGIPERQAGPIPAQAKTAGVVSAKGAPLRPSAKASSPTSTPTAPGPSKTPGAEPPTTKPAGKPVKEAPGKPALGRRDAQVGGGPSGKKADAKAEGPPNPRAAVAPAIAAVQQRAAGARTHAPAGVSVASAQAAAINPQAEQKRSAAAQTVANLNAAEAEGIKRDAFKAKLKQAIKDATPEPKTESAAEGVIKTGATKASGTLRGQLKSEADAAAGPMQSAAASEVPASSQPAPPVTALQSEAVGPPPAPVSASPVVPAPLPPERLDYSADRGPTEQVMAQNNLTKEQMQEANDPAFGPTLTARTSAETHEATAAATYRQGEGKVQDQAQATAAQSLSKDLAGIHTVRGQQIGNVVSQQLGTKAKDAQERQRITDTINGIKDKTRTDVEAILTSMETEAGNIFETGLKRAEQAYQDAFAEAKGGIGTWLTTWGDDWDKHIEQSLKTARNEYLHEVDKAIDEVSTFVETKLKAAKQRVADGRKEVDNFVKGLDASVKQFGEEALQAVSADFDTMGSEIDQRRDGLINKLTEQYKASYERMSAMEDKLREENKSLWQRVYDATVGLVKKIIEFKNMLLGILGKAAAVIEDIIAHPIRFLGNLVAGVMQGLKNFMSKIGTYLMKGLMDWLFGALAGAGLQLPEKFDLQGIISIVLQILGLTYANFRARAVAIVGEPVVAALEKAAEVFKVVLTEGIPGLWRFIKDQLANLKSMVLDAIFDYIKDKVIMAGITWIIGLLNPASAFFKACKAIYDIVMFFVNRGSQILALVNAVIDSMAAIAKGSIGVAATFVENALAKAIPVAIGFLASLLGLGDPSKPVRGFIEKAQAPVNKAIDWVINLAVKGVKGLIGLAKAGVKRLVNWWKKKVPINSGNERHTLMFDGTDKSATLVVRSEPDKPSDFLDKAGEKKGVAATKRKSPVAIAVGHETKVGNLLQELKKIDETSAAAAAGKKADKADVLAKQLDLRLEELGTHLTGTLGKWGVDDAPIQGVKLPRESFTREQKRGIAAQHKDKSELRKDSKDELINLQKGLARRHVVSSHDISSHYVDVLNKKKISEGKLLLEQRGSISDARTPVTDASQEGIQTAASARYSRFFGYLRNLFIGDSRENSSIQEHLDAGHPDLAGKKLEEHVSHVKRAWALDESIKISRIEDK
ncbi:MAG: hypothetical protein IT391_07315 [Nitrospira sp.]|nr:hypothetical protein [Nitrospira sp.]